MVIEREHLLEHVPRHAAKKALDRAFIKRGAIGGRERVLAATPAHERQPAAVASEEIDADRDILGIVLEAVHDLVRIAEQHAGKGAQRRALSRFVVAVDEVKARFGAEVERMAGEVAIGMQMESDDAHHASSSPARRAASRGSSLSRAFPQRLGVSSSLRQESSFKSPGSLVRNGSSSFVSSGPTRSVLQAMSCMILMRSCACSFGIAAIRASGGIVLL